MKKSLLLLLTIVLSLTACGEKDTICACIEAGEKLNKKSQELLQKSEPSGYDLKEHDKLRHEKKARCKEFETMGGPEMKKRMESCE